MPIIIPFLPIVTQETLIRPWVGQQIDYFDGKGMITDVLPAEARPDALIACVAFADGWRSLYWEPILH